VCAGLLLHTTLLTFSRGGILALLVSGAVAFWLIPKRPLNVTAMVVGLAIALSVSGPRLTDRFESTFAEEEERDGSAESRVLLWRNCVEVMITHPLFGIGPDRFPYVAVQELGWKPAQGEQTKEGHTLWLQTGAELGMPGLLFLASFYAICLWRLIPIARGKRKTVHPWHRDCAIMVIVGLCGFVVSAQFVSLEALEIPYFLCIVGAALLKIESAAEAAARVPSAAAAAAVPARAPAAAARVATPIARIRA
jgi:O-antigen ligase